MWLGNDDADQKRKAEEVLKFFFLVITAGDALFDRDVAIAVLLLVRFFFMGFPQCPSLPLLIFFLSYFNVFTPYFRLVFTLNK